MFCIQFLDHEEGSGARWHDLGDTHLDTREQCRSLLRRIREAEANSNDEYLLSYRIVEVGSDAYYSQPTDKLEY